MNAAAFGQIRRRSAPVWRGRTCADDLNDNELRYLHNANLMPIMWVGAQMSRRQPTLEIPQIRKLVKILNMLIFVDSPG